MSLTSVAKHILHIVYPLHCASCKKALDPETSSPVCANCISAVLPNPKPHCISCGKSVDSQDSSCRDCLKKKPFFTKAYSACVYEGVLKELLHHFKYGGKLALSGALSDLLSISIAEAPEMLAGVDAVTFVPLGMNRLRKRGFNQSKIFAMRLSETYGMPLMDCIEKIKLTKNQNELSRDKRLVNLAGAFRARKGSGLSGLTLLVVDDIMTTGATLNECARVLIGAGAREVRCATLARGV